ncbi:helix-turn-helix transcriptional regulator [Streptomyces mayteni]
MSEEREPHGPPGRLLRLLALLQSRRRWSGAELADRLGVSGRTLRRDLDRLRALDYPVESTTGTAGGYRLASGRNLPPLQLDDEEAVALALGLVMAAGAPGVAGIEESATRALAKLERVLPARLRPRLAALGGAAEAVPGWPAGGPRVDPAMLAVLADCCAERQVLSFDYVSRSGARSRRRVEPHHLVTARGGWYLIAHDPDRADWRVFRVDRIAGPLPTHQRFAARPLPAPDAATFLVRSLAAAGYRHTARLTVGLGADALRARLFAGLPGEIEPRGADACAVRLSAESAELVVQYAALLLALDAAVALTDASPEVAAGLGALRDRLPDRLPD